MIHAVGGEFGGNDPTLDGMEKASKNDEPTSIGNAQSGDVDQPLSMFTRTNDEGAPTEQTGVECEFDSESLEGPGPFSDSGDCAFGWGAGEYPSQSKGDNIAIAGLTQSTLIPASPRPRPKKYSRGAAGPSTLLIPSKKKRAVKRKNRALSLQPIKNAGRQWP